MSGQIRRFFVRPLLQFLVIACLLSGTCVFAQLAGKGAITGRVEDSTGAAIPKAKVAITNVATGISTVTTSSDAGDYSVETLDPGKYTVLVEAPGFQKQKQENVNVNALESVTYNPKLTVGETSTVIDVSAAPPQLQTTNATLGATLEADMYSALPIEMGAGGSADQRRATDFAILLPGVQGNATTGGVTTNSGVINGVGAGGATTVLYVDGVPFTNASGEGDPRFVWSAISVDAINQFQVETSGYSAIYQGQGVQNYTVKQGGIQFHGGGYWFFRNTALDTWGFYKSNNPYTGLPTKPVEHQNEFGFNLSGPPVPFGSLHRKLFYFGNYTKFSQSSTHPTVETFPSVAEQQGNFQGIQPIYDPNTETACTTFYGFNCRYRFGYTHGATPGTPTSPTPQVTNGQPIDIIPANEINAIAQKIQSYLPTVVNPFLINTNPTNNYVSPDLKGLHNYSTTHRVDYNMSAADTFTFLYAHGEQVSNRPVGFSPGSTSNTAPQPYNFGQAYQPKTDVDLIEETHVFSPHIVNQVKFGFARYISAQDNLEDDPRYSATSLGITGAPAGQAADSFPKVSFSGIDAPWTFAGYAANIGAANSFELLDNVQLEIGKHSVTVGAMISWLQYTFNPDTGGTSPITIANAVTETAGIGGTGSLLPSTGVAYASFLLGAPDNVSLTQNTIQATYARFRPISPYIQDNWKVSKKLTLDLGLRWDYFPTYHEKNDVMSYFDPTLANPVTGTNGGLNFAGHGSGTCNCDTPVHNYLKNFGPRLGLAYQVDPATVVRASYGVMYSQGNGVGGSTASRQGTGTIGFSAAPTFAVNSGTYQSTAPLSGGIPVYAPALGIASGPGYGAGYTTTAGHTGTPTTLTYGDPYLGSRAPQFINYTFGFQHQWTSNLTSSITYVGSQGHFLFATGTNARGYYADQLDPKYLSLGTCLTTNVSSLSQSCLTAVQQAGGSIPASFNTGQKLQQALLPFPQYGVTDNYGDVANAHYNALQTTMNLRVSHGVTFMMNYVWSRSIDNDGTFRSGYAIPAAFSNQNRSFNPDEIERTASVINQPHHFVFTGVERLPFGQGKLGGSHAWTRALFGGFQFSQIVQAFSGSPLAITGSSCQTNPAQYVCVPTLNSSFTGNARTTKHWSGLGPNIVATTVVAGAPVGPFVSPTLADGPYMPKFTFGNAPRTAPLGLTGPGLFDMDISLRRSFPLHFEGTKLSLQADLYNVTNFVQFGSIGLAVGSSNFGVPSVQANNPRQAQLSARIEF